MNENKNTNCTKLMKIIFISNKNSIYVKKSNKFWISKFKQKKNRKKLNLEMKPL